MELSIGLAFIAGLVSFVSPCVLPLVPAYIGYMGGRVTHTVAAQTVSGVQISTAPPLGSRLSTVLHGLAFVLGFTFIFVVLGIVSTAFIFQIGGQNISLVTDIIGRVGGVLIIFFGLHFMGVMPALFRRLLANDTITSNVLTTLIFALIGSGLILWGFIDWIIAVPVLVVFWFWLIASNAFTAPHEFWTRTLTGMQTMLYSDTRMQMTAQGQQNFSTSAIMGVIFAAGWTPCIGPVYGAVLTMAANGGDLGQASIMLTAYSLGLGIPFLLTALLLDSAQIFLRRIQQHMRTVELASGALLVLIGIAVASGQLQRLSESFAGQFADFSVRVEECALGVVNGELPFSDLNACLNEEGLTLPEDTLSATS